MAEIMLTIQIVPLKMKEPTFVRIEISFITFLCKFQIQKSVTTSQKLSRIVLGDKEKDSDSDSKIKFYNKKLFIFNLLHAMSQDNLKY